MPGGITTESCFPSQFDPQLSASVLHKAQKVKGSFGDHKRYEGGLITRGGHYQACAKCSESDLVFIPTRRLTSQIITHFYGNGRQVTGISCCAGWL